MNTIDASGFITAPIGLVRDLVQRYLDTGCDRQAMRETVAFVLSGLVERFLLARLTHTDHVTLGEIRLTLQEAETRIDDLRALPVF